MEINSLKILDMFYPVGSYYETSDKDFDPNKVWGGTWVKDTDGLVLVSEGSGGAAGRPAPALPLGGTGGEYQHSHKYGVGYHNFYGALVGSDGWGIRAGVYDKNGTFKVNPNKSESYAVNQHTNRNTGMTLGTSDQLVSIYYTEGESSYTNNLPPYVVVARWHRTA